MNMVKGCIQLHTVSLEIKHFIFIPLIHDAIKVFCHTSFFLIAPVADLVIENGRQQVPQRELRPENRGEVDDGIVGLPEKEIRESFLPRGSDHQVNRGRGGSVKHRL